MSARFRNVTGPGNGLNHELPLVSDFYIRVTHPAAFRSGQWAKVLEVAWLSDHGDGARPVYVVEFVDGTRDLWPVYDTLHGYEFAWEPT